MVEQPLGRFASAFAPASSGNVSVGFDLLGAALQPINGEQLGDRVDVRFAEHDTLDNVGPYAHVCPTKPSQNLAWQAYLLFRSRLANPSEWPNVAMTLHKGLPVGSGLGSSGCSVVAALAALNRLFGHYFDDATLLALMGEVEAGASGDVHLDNVAPSYFGGLQLMTKDLAQPVITLPNPDTWFWVVAYPGYALATKEARGVLPSKVDRSVAIKNAQNLAVFVSHLYRNEQALAAQAIEDVLAEPYRAALITGFAESKQALLAHGALAVGISGAGPTLFAITDDANKAKQFESYLTEHYIRPDSGFVHICRCAEQGARDLP